VTLKAPHVTGIALSGVGGFVGVLGTALGWFTTHVHVNGGDVCESGLPTSVIGVVTALLAGAVTVGGLISGVIVLLKAPSTSPAVNVAAAIATGEVTGRPMAPPPVSGPMFPGGK
jgi:hypothetical protein